MPPRKTYTEREQETALLIQSLSDQVKAVKHDTEEIAKKLESSYIQRIEFELRVGRLEKIVYGLVATVLVSVLGAIMALVLRARS